jgi:tight adherence protein B
MSPLFALKYAGSALLALGLGFSVRAALSGETPLTRSYRRYTAHLDRSLHLLFLDRRGNTIAATQLGLALAFAVAGLWLDELYFAGSVLSLIAPHLWLARQRRKHVQRLEAQIDALMIGLANALKTVPSPAAALAQVVVVLPQPMNLEIDRVLREMRVGGTLEQGLLNLSARVKSPDLDAALSALQIGLQVGGNLPLVLESTGATVREMNRLEGVVRTKTSEGRAQLWVLGVFPFAICLALKTVDPAYFVPLQTTTVGTLVTTLAVLLWLAALATARKIIKVEI